MNRDHVGIAVFAKAPIAGQAKTRLMPALGADGAARLHAELVERTLETACAAGVGPVTLWCAGELEHPFFEAMATRFSIECRPQQGRDLGERMLHAFTAQAPGESLILIGTDCPALDGATLRQAAESLTTHDAVLAPAEDGGYVLIGLNAPERSLFENVPWGGREVMATTRRLLHQASLRWRALDLHWDLDRPEDLPRYQALLESTPTMSA